MCQNENVPAAPTDILDQHWPFQCNLKNIQQDSQLSYSFHAQSKFVGAQNRNEVHLEGTSEDDQTCTAA